ncbi:MAG: glycine cleavage system protein GcvH, partial [Deltaproteobacteria bacterium]|nr:glycine cleavage system protein GcvH [Deltaproteobacteria bacterium]
TTDHEWARTKGDTLVVGITAFAIEQLGDVTLVDLPAVGTVIERGKAFGVVESVKSVSDLFAPVSGTVTAQNALLASKPELVNEAPYGAGWMIELRPSDPSEVAGLLDAAAYSKLVADSAQAH